MPAFELNLGELAGYNSVKVSQSAFSGLKTIFGTCISPGFFTRKHGSGEKEGTLELAKFTKTEQGGKKDMDVTLLNQSVSNLMHLLTKRFSAVSAAVFKLIGFFAEKLKNGLIPEFPALIQAVINGRE